MVNRKNSQPKRMNVTGWSRDKTKKINLLYYCGYHGIHQRSGLQGRTLTALDTHVGATLLQRKNSLSLFLGVTYGCMLYSVFFFGGEGALDVPEPHHPASPRELGGPLLA